MKMEQPPIPTYDGIKKKANRSGRSALGWQFFCTACGFVFGSCNDEGARNHTMKRLQNIECEHCGAKEWDNRVITD